MQDKSCLLRLFCTRFKRHYNFR